MLCLETWENKSHCLVAQEEQYFPTDYLGVQGFWRKLHFRAENKGRQHKFETANLINQPCKAKPLIPAWLGNSLNPSPPLMAVSCLKNSQLAKTVLSYTHAQYVVQGLRSPNFGPVDFLPGWYVVSEIIPLPELKQSRHCCWAGRSSVSNGAVLRHEHKQYEHYLLNCCGSFTPLLQPMLHLLTGIIAFGEAQFQKYLYFN